MTCPMNLRTLVTATLKDGTSPTPLSMTFTYLATLSVEPGRHDLTRIRLTSGEFANVPPVMGNANETVVTLSGVQLMDVGDNGTALVPIDLLYHTGEYDTWVSTTDTAGTCEVGEKTFDLELAYTHDGVSKTLQLGKCVVTGGVSFSLEPAASDITITSAQPYPTFA